MKKLVTIAIAILLALSVALSSVGCDVEVGGTKIKLSDWDGLIDFTETEDIIEYTWFLLDGQLSASRNNIVIKEIEEKFNVKIKVIGGGANDWKMSLANKINANEIPDLFFSLPDEAAYSRHIATQTILPLDPLIEKASATNLKTLFAAEPYSKTAKIAGINFFAPLMQEATGHAFYVNKEWMSAWNASRGEDASKKPETLEELTSMLQYFHDDKELGIGTTYGLALSQNWDFIKSLTPTFGAQIDWTIDEEGNFELSAFTEEYKALLDWLKAGVENGYIYPGFNTDSDGDAIQKLVKKICGANINNGDVKIEEVADSWDPTGNTPIDDVLVCIAPPSNGANEGAFWGTHGYWGGVSIGATAKEPMRLIRILNYLYSKEGSTLMKYGKEGRTFDYAEDGSVVIDERHYSNRKSDNVFYTPKKMGDYLTKPIGGYMFNFVGMPFEYVDGKVQFIFNSANFWNKEFAQEVYTYSKTKRQEANPRFLLDDADWIKYNNQVLDAAKIFSVNYVKGNTTYEKGIADLQAKLAGYRYDQLKEYLKEKNAEIYG